MTATMARPLAHSTSEDQLALDESGSAGVGVEEMARFAYRQGMGKNLLSVPQPIEDGAVTGSCVPPLLARGRWGIPLPTGGNPTLATPFPGTGGPAGAEALGHLLAAMGLQRREPSHPYADHRAVASGRAKYPVHVFVLDDRSVHYLDVYRHALVDVAAAVSTALRPVPGELTVVLAGRYQDLPATYQLARASIVEAELGIALRAITVTAELHGVSVKVAVNGASVRHAAALVTTTGPGTWSAPLVLTLGGVSLPASVALAGSGQAASVPIPAAADRLLQESDPVSLAIRQVSATRLAVHRAGPGEQAALTGMPHDRRAATPEVERPAWARVLSERSAGRVAGRRHGYALRPHLLSEDCLQEVLGWAGVVPAERSLRIVAERVTVRVAVQHAVGYDNGLYRMQSGGLVAEFIDPAIMRLLAARGGQASSPSTEIGLRHAGLAWVFTADAEAVLAELGPAGWPLLQLYCGWAMHGIGLAAAAHGLISRPSRSYDEPTLQHTLRLPRKDVPLFMTICGRSAFDEPMLDLRP